MKQVDGREGSELQIVHQGAIRAQSSLHLHTQILQQVQDHLETHRFVQVRTPTNTCCTRTEHRLYIKDGHNYHDVTVGVGICTTSIFITWM